MSQNRPFSPNYTKTVTVTPGNTAADTLVAEGSEQLELSVLGTQTVFIRVTATDGTDDATNTDYPILAGQTKVITRDQSWGRVSYLAPAGAGSTLYITPGSGY